MTAAEIRAVLRRHGLRAGVRLGQHFLCAPPILRRIVEASAVGPGDTVLEVGPGIGVLTAALAATGADVWAVELDRALRPALLDVLGAAALAAGESRPLPELPGCAADAPGPRLRLLWADAVRLPWAELAAARPGPWQVCSNLPYYITGPFLASLFRGGLDWQRAVLLVQQEAAARMLAAPGGKEYGAFTCLVRYHAEVERVLSVPPQAFLPPPQVRSAVVRLTRRPAPCAAPPGPLFAVVRAAFAQRRKTLRNALSAGLELPPAAVVAALLSSGIAPERRGETLELGEFDRLTGALLQAGCLPSGA